MKARAIQLPGTAGSTLRVQAADGKAEDRRWADDLIDRLGELQNEDGSFKSLHDRWLENNPVLITAYSLLALGNAR